MFKYTFWLQAVLNGDYWICLEQCDVSCTFVQARETFRIPVNSSCFVASQRVITEQKWPLVTSPSPTSPDDHQLFFHLLSASLILLALFLRPPLVVIVSKISTGKCYAEHIQ